MTRDRWLRAVAITLAMSLAVAIGLLIRAETRAPSCPPSKLEQEVDSACDFAMIHANLILRDLDSADESVVELALRRAMDLTAWMRLCDARELIVPIQKGVFPDRDVEAVRRALRAFVRRARWIAPSWADAGAPATPGAAGEQVIVEPH